MNLAYTGYRHWCVCKCRKRVFVSENVARMEELSVHRMDWGYYLRSCSHKQN